MILIPPTSTIYLPERVGREAIEAKVSSIVVHITSVALVSKVVQNRRTLNDVQLYPRAYRSPRRGNWPANSLGIELGATLSTNQPHLLETCV